MKLGDKAEEAPDVTLVDDILESYYQLQEDDPELTAASDLSPEGEFPQYGDFLEVHEKSPVDGTFRGETWLLIPQGLAQWLVEEKITSDDWWTVLDKQKDNGTWKFECEVIEDEG